MEDRAYCFHDSSLYCIDSSIIPVTSSDKPEPPQNGSTGQAGDDSIGPTGIATRRSILLFSKGRFSHESSHHDEQATVPVGRR